MELSPTSTLAQRPDPEREERASEKAGKKAAIAALGRGVEALKILDAIRDTLVKMEGTSRIEGLLGMYESIPKLSPNAADFLARRLDKICPDASFAEISMLCDVMLPALKLASGEHAWTLAVEASSTFASMIFDCIWNRLEDESERHARAQAKAAVRAFVARLDALEASA